ncbi:glycosyl transferase [Hyphomonas polymorpha PS728]|uniref:Glycosyl transferase n=1 Tax=Hyphomonas polymorpha PS728 TaxID=1280954 RepID=A0A062VA86_9PROT|nr:glycosyltransferase [Hyphomonas polymorpha]KCZ97077.1 glycosyl transferase [Hyphomonas polymorpha PS728]
MGADGETARQLVLPLYGGGLREPSPDMASAHAAAHSLAIHRPEDSAIRTLTAAQMRGAGLGLLLLAGLAVSAPEAAFAALSLGAFFFFVAALAFRGVVYLHGIRAAAHVPQARRDMAGDDGVLWSVYTLLIALKDEAESAAQLSQAICDLDYPRNRLDIKLLVETGDEATWDALRAQSWPPGTELLIVPPGQPRTKPRALNYGLLRAKGEFVVVYDAEDRPHRDQLKAAVRAFRMGSRDLACVQAPLVGDGDRGWIAGQWALEYAVQFGRILPGLATLGFPIALGGTSNHFRRALLEGVEGWDPWNVTEDADLGLRLARSGLQVGVIEPPTLEAPPEALGVWLAQRSRWLKGFLQTWLVVMRRPRKAMREMGAGNFLALQLTLGAAILSALVHGPWAVWLATTLVLPGIGPGLLFLWFIGASYAASIAMALAAPGARDLRRYGLALTLPLYWPLQSIAMVRALYSLARRPHFWAKTPHGSPAPVRPRQPAAPVGRIHSSEA